MQLHKLKERTYYCWFSWQHFQRSVVVQYSCATQDTAFKQEVRQNYGDLRRKETWIKAFAAIEAKSMWDSVNGYDMLVQYSLIQIPREEGYTDLVPQILEALCMIKGAAEAIVKGLAKTLEVGATWDVSPQEMKEFAIHAFQIEEIERAARAELRRSTGTVPGVLPAA